MTKQAFLDSVTSLYRFCQLQAGDQSSDWTCAEMVEEAGCEPLDSMIKEMLAFGALTADEVDAFYSGL